MLAMTAAIGAASLSGIRSTKSWTLLGLLTIGQLGISAANFPDHLAYFNVLAGAEPEHLLVDSDLDWGQDVNRVASELRPPDIGTGR